MGRKEYFTIPNMMGYFRILMIPVFLYLYYHAETSREYLISFLVLAVSYLTDLFDGKIARKFHCVTEFGKILDPFADKLTQGAIAIAVSFRNPMMRLFLILFVCKEMYMGIMGYYIMKKYRFIHGAQIVGKIYTWIVDVGVMVLLFFTTIPMKIANGIVGGMIVILIGTWIWYLKFHIGVIQEQMR